MLCGCAWIRPPFVAPDILLSLLNFNTTDLKAHKFNQTMCLCLTNNGTVGNLQLNCYSANYGHGRFALPLSTIYKLLEVLHFLIAWVVNGKWTFISRSLFAFFFLPTYWISSVHAPSNASNKNKNGEKAARHKQEIRKDNNNKKIFLQTSDLPVTGWPTLLLSYSHPRVLNVGPQLIYALEPPLCLIWPQCSYFRLRKGYEYLSHHCHCMRMTSIIQWQVQHLC